MAIYHLSAKMISRSNRSTVGAVAYRTGTKLIDRQTGESSDYRKKSVDAVDLIVADNAPDWAIKLKELVDKNREMGVQHFSDLCESAEKRKDAQVYREYEIALPRELTDEQGKELARKFIKENLSSKGPMCLASFHMDVDDNGDRKPHCHILMTTRGMTEKGLSDKKLIDLNRRQFLEESREQWASCANEFLKQHGINETIDHRSYKERGIDLVPQPKMSWGKRMLESERKFGRFDHMARVVKEFDMVKVANQYKILRKPEMIFQVIQEKRAVFGWGEVQSTIASFVHDRGLQETISNNLRKSSDLLSISDEKGEGAFTTKTMRDREVVIGEIALKMSEKSHVFESKKGTHTAFSGDQKIALQEMLKPKNLVCIEGPAGSGKTTLIKEASRFWEEDNLKVYGVAPTGKAAMNFEGIPASTIHRFLKDYEQGRSQFKKGSVLVVDEAGMVNTSCMQGILTAADKLALKVVLIGDSQQLRPVGAGRPFDLIKERLAGENSAELTTIRRQDLEWQREASSLFSEDKTDKALQLYLEKGKVRVGEESFANLDSLIDKKDASLIVERFVLSRKMIGRIYAQILEDGKTFNNDKGIGHKDWESYIFWKDEAQKAGSWIGNNYSQCLSSIKSFEVNPEKLKSSVDEKAWQAFEKGLAESSAAQLSKADLSVEARRCLVEDWKASYKVHSNDSHLVLAATNNDVTLLNKELRIAARELGLIEKEEREFFVEKPGGDKPVLEKRSFSCGDRLLITRNDFGLGVRNGTVGTIKEIEGKNLNVTLDDGRDIRFSTNLFKHFDHGWAMTIHKSQGITVDRSFLLASYGMDKHLSNVALTRHRKDVSIYASNLEFWNKSVLLNRLSSQTEKEMATDREHTETVVAPQSFWSRAKVRFNRETGALKGVAKIAANALRGYEAEASSYVPAFDKNYTSSEKRLSNYAYLGAGPYINRDLGIKVDKQGYEHMKEIELSKHRKLKNEPYSSPQKLSYDRDQVLSGLSSHDIEKLGDAAFGAKVKKKHGSYEMRYGKKGSTSLQISGPRKGMWFDFKTSEGGDIFHLAMQLGKADSYGKAITYLGDKTGIEKIDISTKDPSKVSVEEKALDAQKRLKSIEHAGKTFMMTKPVEGTLGEVYLREHRGYKGIIPEDIRFANYRLVGDKKYPTLMNFVRDKEGNHTGYQEIYLDPKTGNKATDVDIGKRSRGLCKGSSVFIQSSSNSVLFIAEGVETALSLKAAGIKGNIEAGLGRYVFKNLEIEAKTVVLVGDYDGPNAKTHDLLEKDAQSLREKGHEVFIVMPECEGEIKKDFNDLLKEFGKEGVQETLYRELPENLRVSCMKEYMQEKDTSLILDENYRQSYSVENLSLQELAEQLKRESDDPSVQKGFVRAADILIELREQRDENPTLYDKEIALKRGEFEETRKEEIKEELKETLFDSLSEQKRDLGNKDIIDIQFKTEILTAIEGNLYEKDLINLRTPQEDYKLEALKEVKDISFKIDIISEKLHLEETVNKEQSNLTATLIVCHEFQYGHAPTDDQTEAYKDLSKTVCEERKSLSSEEQYLVTREALLSKEESRRESIQEASLNLREEQIDMKKDLGKEVQASHDKGLSR